MNRIIKLDCFDIRICEYDSVNKFLFLDARKYADYSVPATKIYVSGMKYTATFHFMTTLDTFLICSNVFY